MYDEIISTVHAEKISCGRGVGFFNAFENLFSTLFHSSEPDLLDKTVLIKPNLNNFSSTDLKILELVTLSLQAKGAIVTVGDSPLFLHKPVDDLYQSTGLTALSNRLQFNLIQLESEGTEKVQVGNRQYFVSNFARQADIVINLTGSVSSHFPISNSLIGFLPGFQGSQYILSEWGRYELGEVLVDLLSIIKPDLHISFVELRRSTNSQSDSYIVGSTDLVALESVLIRDLSTAATNFQVIGSGSGLGQSQPEAIRLSGEIIDFGSKIRLALSTELKTRFGLPILAHLSLPIMDTKLILNHDQCEACGDCVRSCGSGALQQRQSNQPPELQQFRCLNCWECLFRCKNGAIKIQSSSKSEQLINFWRRTCAT